MATPQQLQELGPRYDVGIDSPTFGWQPFFLRPVTYRRQQQLIKRQDVVAALTQAIADRDIDFWTRFTQSDWSKGQGQKLMGDVARYDTSSGIDVHTPGAISLVPQWASVSATATACNGRGCGFASTAQPGLPNGNPAFFFPWTDGNYTYSTDGGATWNTSTTPAGGKIADIVSNGASLFFGFQNVGGVWTTGASAPGALTQYDTGAQKYVKLVYDPLRKNLYGITLAVTGVQLHKINSGGAFTLIFDFVQGRLDAMELYQGNIVIAWNQAAFARGAGQTRIYSYDGTNVTRIADLPDNTFVTGMRAVLGFLFLTVFESDGFQLAPDRCGLYFMVGNTAPQRIDTLDAAYLDDIGASGCFTGYPHFMLALGPSLFALTKGRFQRYDTAIGGISRSFGDDSLVVGGVSLNLVGAASARGAIYALAATPAAAEVAVVRLNPSGAGGLISGSGAAGQQLTGSRVDLGLPYVDKYWFGIECVFDYPLPAGSSIAMEYSFDDGATWTACSNSPLTAAQANALTKKGRFTFLVKAVNPHIKHRVTLNAAAATAGPTVHAISLKFAPSNPNLHVWQFTVTAYDNIRGRGNKVEDSYGKDMIAFLENIAQQSETVTFYDWNDSARTPHTVWVLQAEVDVNDTSATYSPTRQEGDVPIILWETG